MPDTGESFRGQEHLLAVAFAGNFFLAPMHLDRLLIITLDGRDPHPDVGIASQPLSIVLNQSERVRAEVPEIPLYPVATI